MKKSKFSKLIVFCLALVMTVSMFGTMTFALTSQDKGSIILNNVDEDLRVDAYRIITVNIDDTSGQPKDPVYKWNADIASWLMVKYPDYIDENGNVTDAFGKLETDAAAAFYDALALAVKTSTVTPKPFESVTAEENKTAKLEDLEMGAYLMIIEDGMRVYRPAVATIVPEWNKENNEWVLTEPIVKVDTKSSLPEIEKTIVDADDNNKGDAHNVSIGDAVEFKLVANVPQFPESATGKNFVISDILSKGLTFTENSLKVYGVNDENTQGKLLTSGDDKEYKISNERPVVGEDGKKQTTTFTLEFNYDKIKEYSKIRVEYSAVLNADALITDSNNNTAYLDYTNNPYTEDSWESDEDKVDVYTYGIDITKVSKNDNEIKLEGAKFVLKDSTGKEIKFAKEENGAYHKLAADETPIDLITAADGKLILKGLDAGTYTLTEVEAPAGYNLLREPITVVISDEDLNGKVEYKAENDSVIEEDGFVELTVENGQGFELPITGGTGTVIFAVAGVVLMGMGVVLLFVIRKRNKTSN